MSPVMFKSVSPKHVTFLFTHNAYINIPVHFFFFNILQNIATILILFIFPLFIFPLQTWKINSSSSAQMDKVIVPESLCAKSSNTGIMSHYISRKIEIWSLCSRIKTRCDANKISDRKQMC